MPPQVALLLTLGFVAFLYQRDIRERPNITWALWLPLLWMLIIGSRFVSEWLSGSFDATSSSLAEGSPLDALIFLVMILLGLAVLARRRVRLRTVVWNNVSIAIFLVFCLMAVLWSDFPFVAFKRWFKILGHPVMALVVLTEPDPDEAVRRLMKRCAYVLLPISILLIKYFPEIGRGFDGWTGQPSNFGITTNKNALGYDCMVLGVFFVAHAIWVLRSGRVAIRREILLTSGSLWMIGWLMWMANSQTSNLCLFAGATVVICLGFGWIKRRPGLYLVAGVLILVAAESGIGFSTSVIHAVGRNSTLTDRTQIWNAVLAVDLNPVVGAGFESFWMGERLERLWAIFPFKPVQAHNGYIETYLNLGLIGLGLLTLMILATFGKAKRALGLDAPLGRFRMALLITIVVYNYTEASFKALHLVWFAFYIIALEYRGESGIAARAPNRVAFRPNNQRGRAAIGRRLDRGTGAPRVGAGIARRPENSAWHR